ncbi:hypothetical protein [Mesorhizobium sp.]|uniref:hypothetical protein n=1 Tax=Mesorhizobium sp. TaxID=1871066 RepID=UPI000FE5A71D|nr:hypothetical protein [Mesorhizobium sp.]RWP05113.1 MAG: hypothetical protein EOQ99_16720 [Mesorhizobium sp.]
MATTTVEVKSAWYSKINWTQALGLIASILVVFGVDVPAEVQVQIVAGIQAAQAVVTWVLKTWFSDSVTPSAAGK